jgi:membrane-bound lytic murein transglycosylase D
MATGLLAITTLAPMNPAWAGKRGPQDPTSTEDEAQSPTSGPHTTVNGQAIYRDFRDGLADKTCAPDASARWKKHFASAPARLAARDDDALPLFGYVVDALRDAHLPTEYALIPFVESGYRPEARSPAGPTGLWQMIARTARHHGVPIRAGYDGRLSPVDSTRAAVRYLRTLHGRFGGNWQLVAMAYNAGEHRILGAVKRSGRRAASIDPDALTGVPDITRAYPGKLHALSCLLDRADDREPWRAALDREVPNLSEVTLPAGATDLREWARHAGHDPRMLARLNPAHANGPLGAGKHRVLAPVPARPAPDAAE